jgi:hypothetical protein
MGVVVACEPQPASVATASAATATPERERGLTETDDRLDLKIAAPQSA